MFDFIHKDGSGLANTGRAGTMACGYLSSYFLPILSIPECYAISYLTNSFGISIAFGATLGVVRTYGIQIFGGPLGGFVDHQPYIFHSLLALL